VENKERESQRGGCAFPLRIEEEEREWEKKRSCVDLAADGGGGRGGVKNKRGEWRRLAAALINQGLWWKHQVKLESGSIDKLRGGEKNVVRRSSVLLLKRREIKRVIHLSCLQAGEGRARENIMEKDRKRDISFMRGVAIRLSSGPGEYDWGG